MGVLLMSTHQHLHPAQPAVLRPPRSFKIVRVASGAVLAEGTDTRTTIDMLTQIDSIFDVTVYVWHTTANTWRPLTTGEQRTLWDFRVRHRG